MRKTLLCLATLLAVSACSGDVKSSLGLKKSTPDEFTVVSNPPLTLPPDFSLRPPEHQESFSKSEPNILAYNTPTSKGVSSTDAAFLNKFETSTSGDMRSIVDKDYLHRKHKRESKGVIRKTLSTIRGENDAQIVNPVAERKRIEENLAAGKPINEGETKVQTKSTLDRILGR